MVRTVKLDKRNNYLLDSSTGERLERFDPKNENTLLILKLDNSVLNVDYKQIQHNFGNIIVQHNEDRYIIDDGYQNTLIKAGYMVYKDYDTVNEFDKSKGVELRTSLIEKVYATLLDMLSQDFDPEYMHKIPCKEIGIRTDLFEYTVNIDTINGIVAKNQVRKENSLPFFPFEKDMDKYGTVYVSVYAQKICKITQDQGDTKFKFAETLVRDLTNTLGDDFKFHNMPITKRVLYWNK